MESHASDSQRATVGLENVVCDLCGGSDAAELLRGTDWRYGNPGEFPVVRCRDCRLVFLNPRPTQDAMGAFYPSAYRPHGDPRLQHAGRLGERLRRGIFSRRLGGALSAWLYNSLAFRAFLPAPPGRLLDVGCGSGAYLAAWSRLGWSVAGLEPSADAAEVARRLIGCRVFDGHVEEVTLPLAAYDVITLCHTLEHMSSPLRVLEKLRTALAADGRLLVMVPNFAAWDRRVFGADWYGLEVPRHLYHFEPDTLQRLLTRAGFAVERLWGSAHPDVVARSLRRRLGMSVAAAAEVSAAERALVSLLMLGPAALRRSTSLWVVARVSRAQDRDD